MAREGALGVETSMAEDFREGCPGNTYSTGSNDRDESWVKHTIKKKVWEWVLPPPMNGFFRLGL